MPLRVFTLVLAIAASLGLAACRNSSQGDENSARAPRGTTGSGAKGTSAMGGPGAGLQGGMAPSGSASQPTAVPEGGANRTPRSSVGNR
jgi:hypothetical protein